MKIRGFRIEPGEIEAVLKTHERVQDALVMVHEQAGQKQLLGYVISRQGEAEQAQAQASHIEPVAAALRIDLCAGLGVVR